MQPGYEYKLIYNRDQSRKILLDAAKQAQHRLILVCPWLHKAVQYKDQELVSHFEAFLSNQKGQIDIGWGHWQDMRSDIVWTSSGPMREKLKTHCDMYGGLEDLEYLEEKYPEQFRLKLLGTHEKFLVCDHQFAMLGSHNFLSSSDCSLREREIGLYTTDRHIIDELIECFENARNLEVKKQTYVSSGISS
jgi:hypothetical protein